MSVTIMRYLGARVKGFICSKLYLDCSIQFGTEIYVAKRSLLKEECYYLPCNSVCGVSLKENKNYA